MHTGSCLCGSIRYEVDSELGDFGFCHCRSCRKASGSAFSANASVDRKRIRFPGGTATLRAYESSPGKFRAFCSQCGSPIYAWLESSRDTLRLRLGSLDTPYTGQPKFHIFVSDKAPWDTITDEVPQYPEWRSSPG
ncbi:MAG: GFA family protein [Gammaproteobacteria bacterium]|nr:GFA family protein [Gammaproteobacteria bacterium]